MFDMKKVAYPFVVGLLLAILAAGCGGTSTPSPSPSASGAAPAGQAQSAPITNAKDMTYEKAMQGWDQVVANAKKEGKLVVNAALGGDGIVRAYIEAWKSEYPEIALEITNGSQSTFYEKEKTEARAGINNIDLTMGGLTTGNLAVKEGFSQPFFAPEAFNPKRKWSPSSPYDPQAGRPDGQLMNFTYYFFGIVINTNMVKPADEPKSLKDMLDAKWKGKTIVTNPGMSGPGDNWYYGVHKSLGIDILKQLGAQRFAVGNNGNDNANAVGRGEYAASFPISVFMKTAPLEKGLPIKFILPEEGVVTTNHGVRISKSPPHPNAAKLFTNWLLTDKAQALLNPTGGFGPLLEGTPVNDPIFNMQGKKVIRLNAEDYPKFLDHWAEAKEIFGIR